jgi:hypothetical protein
MIMQKASGILWMAIALAVAVSCAPQPRPSPAAKNPNDPGATGRTDVRGDDSTIAGDRKGTVEEKEGTP